MRQRGVAKGAGQNIYIRDWQVLSPESDLAVRARLEPLTIVQAVKNAVMRDDAEKSVFDIKPMARRVLTTI